VLGGTEGVDRFELPLQAARRIDKNVPIKKRKERFIVLNPPITEISPHAKAQRTQRTKIISKYSFLNVQGEALHVQKRNQFLYNSFAFFAPLREPAIYP
jgi:hypothetical protein